MQFEVVSEHSLINFSIACSKKKSTARKASAKKDCIIFVV